MRVVPSKRPRARTHAQTLRRLSDELVELQAPIRVLDAIAWSDGVAAEFFAGGGGRQPAVDEGYYRDRRPLRFDPDDLRSGLRSLRRRIESELGEETGGRLLTDRVDAYLRVIDLLEARGTPAFGAISAELYGHLHDRVHPGGPTLSDLGAVMTEALSNIDSGAWEPPEPPTYDARAGVEMLTERLDAVFGSGAVRIIVDDGIVADAAAGGDYIKLREDARFSERDLRILEVHEGWVHVATTLNGRAQPWCTFLAKGTPSTTATQEGLAVFTEITTMSSTPERLRRVTRRMVAIGMAADGATFLDVYRWLLDEGLQPEAAWASSVRVFRGSTPTGPPFTKDLVYSRGFLEVYDFMRLAVRRGLLDRLALLFSGKLAIHELGTISRLAEDGLVTPPAILPPHVRDISALAAWLTYSNLLNRIDLSQMEQHLGAALS